MDPIPGRCFALYHNQTRVGRPEIMPSYNYTTETPQLNTYVRIDSARLLGFRTLTDFLWAIAAYAVRCATKQRRNRFLPFIAITASVGTSYGRGMRRNLPFCLGHPARQNIKV
jgi:hypothetical protein